MRDESEKPTDKRREKWKKQIAEAVKFLHGEYITIGGRSGTPDAWYFINQHTVRIAGHGSDTDGDAWLTLGAGCTSHQGLEGADAQIKFDEERAMDLKGIEQTFQG